MEKIFNSRQASLVASTPVVWHSGSLKLTLGAVLVMNLACSLYASIDARGLYADGAALLVANYERKWFFLSGGRETVEILRQIPTVLLSRYTSATLFQCGQVFTFAMLALPTILCSLCWFVLPRPDKAWILFPLTSLLVGFAATTMNAVGEAAIATSYYWVLFFILLFKTRTLQSQALFLLLCIPGFWLQEAAFPLTALLLLAVVLNGGSPADACQRRFAVLAISLLALILVFQTYWIINPRYPGDKELIVRGLLQFEFLYFDDRINLPLVTGAVALVLLVASTVAYGTLRPDRAARFARVAAIAWGIFAVTAIAAALLIENSYSPFSQYQARYQPVIVSIILFGAVISLRRHRVPRKIWAQASTVFVLTSLSVTQAVADLTMTHRWNIYVADLQLRLANGRGLIPWEETEHPLNESIGLSWVIPYKCIIFAPNGVVRAMIDLPKNLTFRPLDPETPDRLPNLSGIDFAPFKSAYRLQKSGIEDPHTN